MPELTLKRDIREDCLRSIFNWACYHGKGSILKKVVDIMTEFDIDFNEEGTDTFKRLTMWNCHRFIADCIEDPSEAEFLGLLKHFDKIPLRLGMWEGDDAPTFSSSYVLVPRFAILQQLIIAKLLSMLHLPVVFGCDTDFDNFLTPPDFTRAGYENEVNAFLAKHVPNAAKEGGSKDSKIVAAKIKYLRMTMLDIFDDDDEGVVDCVKVFHLRQSNSLQSFETQLSEFAQKVEEKLLKVPFITTTYASDADVPHQGSASSSPEAPTSTAVSGRGSSSPPASAQKQPLSAQKSGLPSATKNTATHSQSFPPLPVIADTDAEVAEVLPKLPRTGDDSTITTAASPLGSATEVLKKVQAARKMAQESNRAKDPLVVAGQAHSSGAS